MHTSERVRLTQYSHGAGCGCKIAPAVLEQMLAQQKAYPDDHRLLVGNSSRDDAAALDLGNGQVLISTTDFFMPIVDDAHTFGRIAATNAISDVYAMGGTPVLAIAILGWPINLLPPEIAGEVIAGGRAACQEAGIALAGGHSIDSLEPIFGLAVSGIVEREYLKRNDTGRPGDLLYLTKPLGVGILTTAEKKGLLREQDMGRAASLMTRLNHVGARLGTLAGVHAMTDVTGFGLLGHLTEMCEGSGLRAELEWSRIPTLADLDLYLDLKSTPGGTRRNWDSYGHRIGPLTDAQRAVLCDPQTSGGLLVAVDPSAAHDVEAVLTEAEITPVSPIGRLRVPDARLPLITV